MTNKYLSKEQILDLLSETDNAKYSLILGKRIMYHATLPNGIRKCVCLSTSKYHNAQKAYWIDITATQKDILDSYDTAIVIYILEGLKIAAIKWKVLRDILTSDRSTLNASEGVHWKTYIRDGRIDIPGGGTLPIDIIQLNNN